MAAPSRGLGCCRRMDAGTGLATVTGTSALREASPAPMLLLKGSQAACSMATGGVSTGALSGLSCCGVCHNGSMPLREKPLSCASHHGAGTMASLCRWLADEAIRSHVARHIGRPTPDKS